MRTIQTLVKELFDLRFTAGYSTSDRFRRDEILRVLDGIPDWFGDTERVLDVPDSSYVLHLTRTINGLKANFFVLETPDAIDYAIAKATVADNAVLAVA